jgi:oligogalacturonide lyase
VFLERDTIGHPQFCPDDDDLILYAGPLTDRVWLTDRSGAKNRRLYQREDRCSGSPTRFWVPGRRTVAFVDWPRGMRMIDVDRGVIRQLTYSPAWHAAPDDAGERFVCDTNCPDRGLHYVRGRRRSCRRSRNRCASARLPPKGKHWAGPFPYNDGPSRSKPRSTPIPIQGSQPDGSRVVFTSDKTGYAQIYEVML